jgi:uncharacterized phage protein (TIGR01671 family)
MMSINLYRGKRKDNGEWVIGAALPHDNRGEVTIFRQHPGDGTLEGFEVIPETIGLCSGLVDLTEEHEICEGDIHEFYNEGIPHRLVVKYGEFTDTEYDDEFFGWYCENLNCECYSFNGHEHEYMEIVGNIHDNPELLVMKE